MTVDLNVDRLKITFNDLPTQVDICVEEKLTPELISDIKISFACQILYDSECVEGYTFLLEELNIELKEKEPGIVTLIIDKPLNFDHYYPK